MSKTQITTSIEISKFFRGRPPGPPAAGNQSSRPLERRRSRLRDALGTNPARCIEVGRPGTARRQPRVALPGPGGLSGRGAHHRAAAGNPWWDSALDGPRRELALANRRPADQRRSRAADRRPTALFCLSFRYGTDPHQSDPNPDQSDPTPDQSDPNPNQSDPNPDQSDPNPDPHPAQSIHSSDVKPCNYIYLYWLILERFELWSGEMAE